MSDVAGLCDICNRPSRNLNTCRLCGANVCSKHYNQQTGLCSNCEKGKQSPGLREVDEDEPRRIS